MKEAAAQSAYMSTKARQKRSGRVGTRWDQNSSAAVTFTTRSRTGVRLPNDHYVRSEAVTQGVVLGEVDD